MSIANAYIYTPEGTFYRGQTRSSGAAMELPPRTPYKGRPVTSGCLTDNGTPLRPPGLASGCVGRTAQTAIRSVRHHTILGPKDLTSLSFMTMVSEPGSRFMSLVVSIRMAMPSPR